MWSARHWIIAAGATTLAWPVHAANYWACGDEPIRQNDNMLSLHKNGESFPEGSDMTVALRAAIERINTNPSGLQVELLEDNGWAGVANGETEIFFSDTALSGDVAQTLPVWVCIWRPDFLGGPYTDISETDIIFNSSFPWRSTEVNTPPTSGRLIITTALHEMGHSVGMDHESREYNIMGGSNTHVHRNGELTRGYLGEDASAAFAFIYGPPPTARRDVGVTNMAYAGINGDYSAHRPTLAYISAGPPPTPGAAVKPGGMTYVELTLENNGQASEPDVEIDYYLSSNNLITTRDRFLGSAITTLNRGDVLTYLVQLTIPNDVVVGSAYWVGAVVDPSNKIAETFEWNNAAGVIITIVP